MRRGGAGPGEVPFEASQCAFGGLPFSSFAGEVLAGVSMAIEFSPVAATNFPAGGHLFSPLVATNLPTVRGCFVDVQASGLTPFPAVA